MALKKTAAVAGGAVWFIFGAVFARAGNIYTFSGDVEITEAPPDDGIAGKHASAFRGDTVYQLWVEARSFTPPVGVWIFFAKSTDGGRTFGPHVIAAGGVNPDMAVDSAGIIYVAYQNSGDIFFRKSTDGGATFNPRVKVNDDTIPQIGQEKPAIAVNGKGQVFIAWRDQRNMPPPTARNIFTCESFDGGTSFQPNVQANATGTYANGEIDIAADDSGRVYIAYQGTQGGEFGVVLCRSVDSGQSYAHHILASDLPMGEPAFAENPSIVISQAGLVGVAWMDGRNDRVTLHFSISRDYGQSFSPSVRVDDDTNTSSEFSPYRPSLAFRKGKFYVAWEETRVRAGDSQIVHNIYFSYSLDSGRTFVDNVDVNASDTSRPSRLGASLAVNEKEEVFVSWIDDRYAPPVVHQDYCHLFGARAAPNFIKGDLNLDGLLTSSDAVMELNAVFLGMPFQAPFQNADINCDSLLTAADVILTLNAVFLGILFPCP